MAGEGSTCGTAQLEVECSVDDSYARSRRRQVSMRMLTFMLNKSAMEKGV